MRPTGLLIVCALLVLPAAGFLSAQPPNDPAQTTASVRLADGFDFPVGKPDAAGYHKARGMKPNGHLGDDWDGDRGGNTDLGDPVYAAGAGIVVLADNMHLGWGNVVMVRHCFREPQEGGAVRIVDSLYGHVDTMLVHVGQLVARGQQIATIGTAFGLYEAHLHFEVRKNINIGMYRSQFARDYTNYYDPTEFVTTHRQLPTGRDALVAVQTFVPTPKTGLQAADGAYELGINRNPTQMADMDSSRLKTSALTLKPHQSKPGEGFHVDRYSDVHSRDEKP